MEAGTLGLCVLLVLAEGCGALGLGAKDTWPDDVGYRGQATDAILLRWHKPLVPPFEGPYKPVEGAVPVLSPKDDRVYVGTSSGHFWALSGGGQRQYQYNAMGAIESEAGIDRKRGDIYVGTEDGVLHALRAQDGRLRWRHKVRGSLRQAPVMTARSVFVITDDDEISAIDRRSGKRSWTYHRDAPEGFTIAGHAGLALSENLLITGFSDGVVMAFDPQTGKIAWERDTSIEIDQTKEAPQRFADVDTTPVVEGETVYVASFSGGLFELSLKTGGVDWHRSDWTGITALVVTPAEVVMSSADMGVLCMDRESRSLRWRHKMIRGAPSRATAIPYRVIVGDSTGALLALSIDDGRELSRIESKHGFSGAIAVADHRGYVLSNSGELFAFEL